MNRTIIPTADGSVTIEIPEMGVTYHSRHGAIQESMHVFIGAGWRYLQEQLVRLPEVRILEMGFGTGLNAFLTWMEAAGEQVPVHYTSLERYPVEEEQANLLNYPEALGHREWFRALHASRWEEDCALSPFFSLHKTTTPLQEFGSADPFHLIYFDAFAPAAQPELWTEEIFRKLYAITCSGGVLVTYCSKGDVRRALQAAGFIVSKLPGPPGKREMLRAERGG